jgi:hypothetical protein
MEIMRGQGGTMHVFIRAMLLDNVSTDDRRRVVGCWRKPRHELRRRAAAKRECDIFNVDNPSLPLSVAACHPVFDVAVNHPWS